MTASDKRRLVDAHFETIAQRYDLADAILSFGLDSLWRKKAVQRLALKRGDDVLDLCGGTADFAVLAAERVAPEGTVTVYDISRAMMLAGRRKVERSHHERNVLWVQGDAEDLAFPGDTFDAVTVGFGIRNLIHLERGLTETCRVLKRDGRLAILEFSVPKTRWMRDVYEKYSFRIMPCAGKAITGASAPFAYLAESIRVFPTPERVKAVLEESGFARVTIQRLTGGIAVVYLATKG